ncbi:hypothetical protein ARMGADRAFT_696861 [Armillaria gallica]|uniref:STAS domain-containing protein n=1 Tax=Armillaria gallica TaxID=47427 RepID=A0A2H3DMH8_ARMGA|nr:hypothetical protein ARMGADRAFT_696861 [Armillaria gallica]
MEVVRSRTARWISNTPGRLYRALPSVVLGTLFNVLDTDMNLAIQNLASEAHLPALVSTGLLIFPSEEGSNGVFQALQIQGLSMYIMSTILSQVAMTLGGSHFPGALGAMLIEILPFLRGIGSDIRDVLGPDNPSLVPTVFAAYTMSSFLIGFAFIILGLLKLGNLVAYFPQTVLTGAIGAIGLSLFILGLGLMLPPSSPALTLSSAGSVLFNSSHLPLLVASFFPALILSVSTRSQLINRWTRGMVQNAYYVPCYLFSIPLIFWIIVGALHCPRDTLVTNGWLFRVDASATRGSGIGTAWIYWREFDFSKVEWWAMKNAIENIVLLVVIGVLNLPIYVPALGFSLNVPYDMNHEFFGQGAANILAGIAGTAPNILQYSYSVFFTRANGGRFEAALVTLFTFVLFLTSGLLLPYVPTMLASALVLFLGIELLLEAVWESAKTLLWLEWSIVVGTLMACTFLGFAEGFGVGIGAAIVVYFVYGVVDSRARVMRWEEWNETHMHQSQEQEQHTPTHRISPLNHTPSAAYPLTNVTLTDIETGGSLEKNYAECVLRDISARVVILSGYVYFATIPSLESQLLDTKTQLAFIIVDLSTVHRLETAAAQCFQRAVRDLAPRSTVLVLCGIQKGSGAHADFDRAGVDLTFDYEKGGVAPERGILSFRTRGDALTWCERQSEVVLEKNVIGPMPHADVYRKFCKLFDFDLGTLLENGRVTDDSSESIDTVPPPVNDINVFISMGAHLKCYAPGQSIAHTSGFCSRGFQKIKKYIGLIKLFHAAS